MRTEPRLRLKYRRQLHAALDKLRQTTSERYPNPRVYSRVLGLRTNVVRRLENNLAVAVIAERCGKELAQRVADELHAVVPR